MTGLLRLMVWLLIALLLVSTFSVFFSVFVILEIMAM